MPINTRASGATHIGLRTRNEDSYCVKHDSGLFVVADGVGGAAGGDVASGLVVKTMDGFFEREQSGEHNLGEVLEDRDASALMSEAIYDADQSIIKKRRGKLAQMGSTVAAMLLREGRALVAHVGDSRVYRLRDGELKQLTRDHNAMSEPPKWVGGESMLGNPAYRHQLTRAVGVPGFCTPEFTDTEVREGDRFLLCTDGLTDVLSDRAIKELLGLSVPDEAADSLIKAALVAGASDNITAVVVEVPRGQ